MLDSLFSRLRGTISPVVLALSLLASIVTSALLATAPPVARTIVLTGAGIIASGQAEAALTFSTAARDAQMTAVRDLLPGGQIRIYNGTKPAALGTPAGTLCATLTLSTPAGTVSGGVLTIGSVTQTAASHVSCTPTFIRYTTSGGTAVADIDIGAGAGNVQFTGTVVTGQNVTATGLTLTAGNA